MEKKPVSLVSRQKWDKDFLGYLGFPEWCDDNRFFGSFLDGFKALNGGVKEFTDLQKQMLDQLIERGHFQVTSTDVNCGSGKTTLTVGATVGLLRAHDKIVVVSRPSKGVSPLASQLEELVSTFSGGRARVGTAHRADGVSEVVSSSDVIITSCMLFNDVAHAITTSLRHGGRAQTSAAPKVYVIFDESHQLFSSMAHRLLDRCFPEPTVVAPCSARSAACFEEWKLLQDIKQHFSRRLQQQHQPVSQQQSVGQLAAHLEPLLSMVHRGLKHLRDRQALVDHQCVFLSAGGEFTAGASMAPSSKVIERAMRMWFDVPVAKLISEGANVDSYRLTKIFRVFRSGAEQIGGVAPGGYPMVYEAMMNLAFNWLVDGRLLFIMRRSQVEVFCALLDDRIRQFGAYFTYTTDRDYWNAVDEHGKLLFNIVIAVEDNLQELEGINLQGIKAVYLFSVGKVKDLLEKLQGIGRVGRIGQGYTYTFIMVDCATKRNSLTESRTEEVMLEALGTNSACKPHVVDVMGAKAMQSTISDIPVFRPGFSAPSGERLAQLMSRVREANRIQVCRYLQFDSRERAYVCPNVSKGFKCAWYHPEGRDFTAARTLVPGRFSVRYCKKGLFVAEEVRGPASSSVPKTWTTAGPAPVAPWAAPGACSGAASEKAAQVRFEELFPTLGEAAAAPAKQVAMAPSVASEKAAEPQFRPRAAVPARSVCLFAVFGRMKCKNSRENRPCRYRHPEIAEDAVTMQEYESARVEAVENMRRISERKGEKMKASEKTMPHNRPVPPLRAAVCVPAAKAQVPAVAVTNPVPAAPASPSPAPAVKQTAAAMAARSHNDDDLVIIPPTRAGLSVPPSWHVVSRGAPSRIRSAPAAPPVATAGNRFSVLPVSDGHRIYLDDDDTSPAAISSSVVAEPSPVVVEPPSAPVQQPVLSAEQLRRVEESRVAASILSSLKQSAALWDFIKAMPQAPRASALIAAILQSDLQCVGDNTWLKPDKFGCALRGLLEDRPEEQVDALYEIQRHCHSLHYPKVDNFKGAAVPLISSLFQQLFASGVVEPECFVAWSEDELRSDDSKPLAVVQTIEFMARVHAIIEAAEGSEADSGDEAVKPSRYCGGGPLKALESVSSDAVTSKAERKELKKERRSTRVAGRVVQ